MTPCIPACKHTPEDFQIICGQVFRRGVRLHLDVQLRVEVERSVPVCAQ